MSGGMDQTVVTGSIITCVNRNRIDKYGTYQYQYQYYRQC